eukprot:3498173-Pleurochrysis_carterae.AAC.1
MGTRSARGRHSLTAPPPRSHPQVRPAPAPTPAPRLPLTVSYMVERFPARPGWSPYARKIPVKDSE